MINVVWLHFLYNFQVTEECVFDNDLFQQQIKIKICIKKFNIQILEKMLNILILIVMSFNV